MKKLVLIEAMSMYRMRYVAEVEDNIDHALDSFAGGDFFEMSQKHMGEFDISHREITEKEYLKIFDEDNDYLRNWSEKEKKKFIYKIKYD